jgi:hypothetical protein
MKTLFCGSFVLLMFVASLGSGLAVAQGQPLVDFKMSSPFSVGNVTFPAGSYSIRKQPEDLWTLEIWSDNGHSAFVECDPLDADTPPAKTELTFHKYGNTLFLKQIWIAGNTSGFYLMGGAPEQQARKTGKPSKVSVPATTK